MIDYYEEIIRAYNLDMTGKKDASDVILEKIVENNFDYNSKNTVSKRLPYAMKISQIAYDKGLNVDLVDDYQFKLCVGDSTNDDTIRSNVLTFNYDIIKSQMNDAEVAIALAQDLVKEMAIYGINSIKIKANIRNEYTTQLIKNALKEMNYQVLD